MATDEDTQARLDRILIRVQAGEPISQATRNENCFHWYYRTLKNPERAPINRARREYQEQERYPFGLKPDKAGTGLLVELPTARKLLFQALCDAKGVTMSQRTNSLISADIASFKAGL